MKKSLVLLTTLGLTACHSLNMRALTKVEEGSSLQLPQLEAVYESRVAQAGSARQCNSSVVKSNSPYARIFYREVEKNISDYYTPKAGYIKLNYVSTQTGSGNGWTFFSIIPPFGGMVRLITKQKRLFPATKLLLKKSNKKSPKTAT